MSAVSEDGPRINSPTPSAYHAVRSHSGKLAAPARSQRISPESQRFWRLGSSTLCTGTTNEVPLNPARAMKWLCYGCTVNARGRIANFCCEQPDGWLPFPGAKLTRERISMDGLDPVLASTRMVNGLRASPSSWSNHQPFGDETNDRWTTEAVPRKPRRPLFTQSAVRASSPVTGSI
jgi:hypothetical protein